MEWLQERLNNLGHDVYVLFDCPGQIELYTHYETIKTLTDTLCNKWNYRVRKIFIPY